VFGIRVPALRERREDIPLLADYFLNKFVEENGSGPEGFSASAMQGLRQYDWPGNVRELRNAVRRAAVLAEGRLCGLEDLPPSIARHSGLVAAGPGATTGARIGTGIEVPLDVVVAEHLRRVLLSVRGNKTRAAEILGIPRTSLYHKLRKHGIDVPEG